MCQTPGLEKCLGLSLPGDEGRWEMVQRTYVTCCLWGLAPTGGLASSEDGRGQRGDSRGKWRKSGEGRDGQGANRAYGGGGEGVEKRSLLSHLPPLCGPPVQTGPFLPGAQEGLEE